MIELISKCNSSDDADRYASLVKEAEKTRSNYDLHSTDFTQNAGLNLVWILCFELAAWTQKHHHPQISRHHPDVRVR